MKKRIKKIAWFGLIIFLLMQFYQPAHNISYEQDTSLHFTTVFKTPENIESMLQTSCYDCHSNNTNYPWYSHIQPGAWFMANHIKDGKKELNFSEFGNYSTRRQKSKLKAIAGQIKSDKMPLFSYTIIHKNAILNKVQK
jgi:hypothetical protein